MIIKLILHGFGWTNVSLIPRLFKVSRVGSSILSFPLFVYMCIGR